MEPVTAARSTTYTARMARMRAELGQHGWSAALVLDTIDIAYLTGLQTSNAVLVVTPGEAMLATDFRYVQKARSLGTVTVHEVAQALFSQLGPLVGEWSGGGAVAYVPTALSHRAFLQLTEDLPASVTLRAVESLVGRLREVKDDVELDAIRRASSLLDGAYQLVVDNGIVGRSERDVTWMIERCLRDNGATGMSFEPIVAAGSNGAFPHHTSGDDPIGADTLVTIDIGCVVDDYCSDCTRTFSTGTLDGTLRTIYDVTLRAQQEALSATRAGAVGRDVDAIARDIIGRAGYGDHFGHGLGHGVGMQVHEGPRLARASSSVLEPGNVVTVEPGVYLPGIGGVRIEDLVIITDGEPEVLTNFPKSLIEV